MEIKRRLIDEKLNRIVHWQSQRLSATESNPEFNAWIEASALNISSRLICRGGFCVVRTCADDDCCSAGRHV